MHNAAYGVFRKGQVILNETVNAPDNSSVIVVFLDKRANSPAHSGQSLLEVFETLGAWEDSKDTETIILEIEKSRVSRETDVII